MVAIALPTSGALLGAFLGAQWIGAIPLVVDRMVPPATTSPRLERLGVRHIVTTEKAAAGLAEAGLVPLVLGPLGSTDAPPRADVTTDDLAFLQLTSGTTGVPQASAISHRALTAQMDAIAVVGTQPGDIIVSWLPLHHDMGLVGFALTPIRQRIPCHLLAPSPRSFPRWLAAIDEHGATVTAATDLAYRTAARMAAPGCTLATLRMAVSGAEPVRRTTVEQFESRFGLGPVIRPSYGLGEATLAVTTSRPGTDRTWSATGIAGCGLPMPGVEVEVRDPEGRPCPPGVQGEIHVRSTSLFDGYWRDEAATRKVLVDGWLATGDLGELDDRGELFVSGRIRAMIKRGGELVPAGAVEELAERVPEVVHSAAFGSDGERERLIVTVEARGARGRRAEVVREVARSVRSGLGYAPDEVLVLRRGGIPRTGNGKIRHAELRRLHGAGQLDVVVDA